MRDFRDAKAMARTLRAELAAKDIKITVGESLELIAKAFGAADWNTLSAAIRTPRNEEVHVPPMSESAARPRSGGPSFSADLETTLHRAVKFANERKHEYATLEHLLLALTDDPSAAAVMRACEVDLAALKTDLLNYLDTELKSLVVDDGESAKPTAAFQRVIQRAVVHVQSTTREELTGADLLVAIFSESESHAAQALHEQDVTRFDAVNFLAHGVGKTR